MAVLVSFNGSTYSVPEAREVGWPALTDYLVDLANAQVAGGPQKANLRIATATPVTVVSTDYVVATDLTVPGAVAVNLPAGTNEQLILIVDAKGDAFTNNITITANGAQTINGASTFIINANRMGVLMQYSLTGTKWIVIGVYEQEIVTRTSVDQGANRLQSKDLSANNVKFVDSSDTTKTLAFSASGASAGADLILSSVCTADRTISFPDATTTLVGTGVAQVLTSKDLTSPTNVLSGATAVSFTNVGTVSLFTSSDVVVGRATTDALTNKDINGGTASNTSRITLPKNTTANLSALTRKEGTLVYDTSIGGPFYDTGAALVQLQAVGSGGESLTTITNADYTILTSDGFTTVVFSTGNTNRVCNLPAAASSNNRLIKIKKTDSGTGKVTIDGSGSETIDGALTFIIFPQYGEVTLQCNGSNWFIVGYAGLNKFVEVYDAKTINTAGGTFTSGALRTRDLTDLQNDFPGAVWATLATNQFTLQPGRYYVDGFAPAYAVVNHKAIIRNITDSTNDLIGQSAFTNTTDDVVTNSFLRGTITVLTSAKVFEVQHVCNTTSNTNGFGRATNLASLIERYTYLRITRMDV